MSKVHGLSNVKHTLLKNSTTRPRFSDGPATVLLLTGISMGCYCFDPVDQPFCQERSAAAPSSESSGIQASKCREIDVEVPY